MSDLDRVLVTGGAGFVGSHVAAYYADRGVPVTAVDSMGRVDQLETADETRDTSAYNRRFLEETYPDLVRVVEADVRDRERMLDLVPGHDGIVHAAGQVAVTSSLEDRALDLQVNAAGTLNVLEAARLVDSDPSVVFTSTNKVYGANVNDIPVAEGETRYRYDDPDFERGIPETLPIDRAEHTPYGVSKLAADLYVQDYAARGEVDAASFRMSCIYGSRQFGNEDQGWVAHFVLSCLRDEPLTIFGDGKQVRDVLHVRDLVRAMDTFLQDPGDKPTVYNIGGGPDRTTSLREFLDVLDDEVGLPDVTYDEWREGDQKVYVSDVRRARKHLGWEPEVGVEEGIRDLVDWAREETI
jgi:CDP-paratose 2-epimerase